MFKKKYDSLLFFLICCMTGILIGTCPSQASQTLDLKFDHIHTYNEVVDYLHDVVKTFPQITRLHKIGKSYLGKDLLVLEVTNEATGEGLHKPGYWIDGCLHSGEVIGGEICLNTIQTLVTGYGNDSSITDLVNTRTFYIMPKLNPDGSDHYITKPDGVTSTVRPHDSDGDGRLDEDPPEDLNKDGYVTLMRIRDEEGPLKTSPEDSRLMVPRGDSRGEWRVYAEGIDNDNDGVFNEDGVGGINLNRNWPDGWQMEWLTPGSGPYPLSEQENRAVADFLLAHRNVTGLINYHMSGHVAVYPPSSLHTDPVTGHEDNPTPEDKAVYRVFGEVIPGIIDNWQVQVFQVYGGAKHMEHLSVWGMFIDWAYYHYGVISWIHEVGKYPGASIAYPYDANPFWVTEKERIGWSDKNMEGKLFLDWKSFNHPQLGEVEIGGFLDKIYDSRYKTYTNVMCLPGSDYEELIAKHTKWHLWLMAQSPLVRITDVKITPEDAGYFKIEASIQNKGMLPTYVSQQAIRNKTAKTVKLTLSLSGATLVSGKENADLGHLPGNLLSLRSMRAPSKSLVKRVEWVVKASGIERRAAVIIAISEKGGIDTKKIMLGE